MTRPLGADKTPDWEHPRPPIDPARTAVLVIDMINMQVTRGAGILGRLERDGVAVDYFADRVDHLVVPRLQELLPVCRASGAKVVHLRIGSCRDDFADVTPAFRGSLREFGAREGTWGCEVIAPLAPQHDDLSLLKTGSGAFTSSNLDIHLRNMGIEHVVYTGVATDGCVLLTLAAGVDLGYYGYLVSDATATHSQHLQDVTEEIVAPFMAQVVTAEEMIDRLRAGVPGERLAVSGVAQE